MSTIPATSFEEQISDAERFAKTGKGPALEELVGRHPEQWLFLETTKCCHETYYHIIGTRKGLELLADGIKQEMAGMTEQATASRQLDIPIEFHVIDGPADSFIYFRAEPDLVAFLKSRQPKPLRRAWFIAAIGAGLATLGFAVLGFYHFVSQTLIGSILFTALMVGLVVTNVVYERRGA